MRSIPAWLAQVAVIVVIVTAIVPMGGCQSTAPTKPEPIVRTTTDRSAEELLTQARSADPDRAAMLYLQAARKLADSSAWSDADEARARIEPGLLPRNALDDYHLLSADIALARQDPAAAAASLDQISVTAKSEPRVALTRANLYVSQANFSAAADALMLAGADQKTHDLIWSYMNRASGFLALNGALPNEDRTIPANLQQIQRGWWDLKQSMLQSRSLADQRERLTAWRTLWPAHPATLLPPTALSNAQLNQPQPRHVGLLLPLSGPLARAGRAVRDGYLAAYLQSTDANRPRISLYDTSQTPMAILYEQALINGVELLVGPLAKADVASLSALDPQIPVLALNYLDTDVEAAPRLIQLGLAIEDEADTLVNRLLADHAERLVVFNNTEDWSRRAMHRLEERWPRELTRQTFVDARTITEAVGRAMDVEASRERRAELADMLRMDLEFLPRARQDIDAIVALVNNNEANALEPALRFHFADQVPVYACSQAVRGARREQLAVLNGFRVSELPWDLFDDPLYQAMAPSFLLAGNPFSSLYALGADAFLVSDRLELLANDRAGQLLGNTGVLSLQPDGRFTRELAWGVISGGVLRALPIVASD